MNIIIRELGAWEVFEASEIVREIWGDKAAENVINEMNEMFGESKFPPHYFVAMEKGQIVGFTGFRECFIFPNAFECIWLNVKPSHQGKGIGKMLQDARMERMRQLGGKLVLVMTQKVKLLQDWGFTAISTYANGWTLLEHRFGDVDFHY